MMNPTIDISITDQKNEAPDAMVTHPMEVKPQNARKDKMNLKRILNLASFSLRRKLNLNEQT